ncbi:MAG: T9SS type A sorting domain-containing protein [Winogradskyella sp.]|uniref:T9SS type A sorting domain-containing protein n=1 Tax=Winogradskyella sp. TaxID=1883156 RepID=UPI00385D2F80
MMNTFYTLKNQLILSLIVVLSFSTQAQEAIPFNCDFNAYLFQYNDVYAIDLASGNSYQVAQDVTPGNINAAAYNPADGFIWGSLSIPAKTIVRIGKDFNTTSFYIDELPSNGRYVGDVSSEGIYYLKAGGTTYYKIDLDPESLNYTEHQATETLSQNISIHDWAFNAVDGQLYAVAKSSNILYRINPENGVVSALGVVPILNGLNYTYGAVYFDNEGRFYVSANQTGTIYVIQAVQTIETVDDIEANLFAFGPSSASNDGARCPTAPVLQEICDNGIDDDGDGLIDCEDPSCSGYGMCDTIEPPTSGSNAGGLESNNRLSEQINKRNFNRAKTGYTFDKATAPRVTRDFSYAQRNANTNFVLQDFIPLDVIDENEVIDASPEDLVSITNATEIYGVDYLRNDIPVASILALKTENGVYEHTKYICDRLLGAELIQVSTIDINEQSFIKSIIKNVDGTYEFVLSLAAKVINDGANFSVESHWNLDQYEENVTFYNFQIWSNTIDNLYSLGEEVLNLLNVEKPIIEYNNSTPPTVFVRKGQYINGGLDLQIINTNATESVTLDAGYRATETEAFDTLNSTINLTGYITNVTVDTGNLFDIGFRIGDGTATPDDLFMSDGPWGIDAAQPDTSVSLYEVTTNDFDFDANDFPIERNVNLRGITSSYLATYRALTPRFKAVDLTDYNSFKFRAEGNGNLEITFVKQSITNWNDQYKTTIALTSTSQDFVVPISDLISSNGSDAVLDDVLTIVFTMIAEDGTPTTKIVALNNLRFSQDSALSITAFETEQMTIRAFPNPMTTKATITFMASQNETLSFAIYNQLGKQVYNTTYNAVSGKNSITINRANLSSGLYFCKIFSSQNNFNPLKLIIK